MQLVLPFLIYLGFSIPALLFWPHRGLSGRNLIIAVASAMFGLSIGFVLMLALDGWIDVYLLMFVTGIIVPAILTFVGVNRFGGKGYCVARPNSLIYRDPSRAAVMALVSIICGALVFAVVFWSWNGTLASGRWFLFACIGIPLSTLQLAGTAGSLESRNWRRGVRDAAWSAGVVLFVSFFSMGLYSLYALPVVLYAATVPLVFAVLVQLFAKI